jgi:hypothetical protein
MHLLHHIPVDWYKQCKYESAHIHSLFCRFVVQHSIQCSGSCYQIFAACNGNIAARQADGITESIIPFVFVTIGLQPFFCAIKFCTCLIISFSSVQKANLPCSCTKLLQIILPGHQEERDKYFHPSLWKRQRHRISQCLFYSCLKYFL